MESTDRSTPLFKGGSGVKISATDLRSIKINIHRNIPGTTVAHSEPQRDIINSEELTLKRREGNAIFLLKYIYCILWICDTLP